MGYIGKYINNTELKNSLKSSELQHPYTALVGGVLDYDSQTISKEDLEQTYLTVKIMRNGKFGVGGTPVFYYSVNGGVWKETKANTITISMYNAGDEIRVKGTEGGNKLFSEETNSFVVYGNSMSLIYGDDFVGKTDLNGKTFTNMFSGSTGLLNAENLILPATTLSNGCYGGMFRKCTSLTKAPSLPATTLVNNCYEYMFQDCTSLTTAPTLPATTLSTYCYRLMFRNCTSLTKAPELLAATLVNNCYYGMFNGCSKLNYVKCLATDISISNSTQNWMNGVADIGTFVKDSSVTWRTGSNGIPTNWTVEEV